MCVHVRVYIYSLSHTLRRGLRPHMKSNIYMYISIYKYACIAHVHARTHTHTQLSHTHTHTHIHTYTHTLIFLVWNNAYTHTHKHTPAPPPPPTHTVRTRGIEIGFFIWPAQFQFSCLQTHRQTHTYTHTHTNTHTHTHTHPHTNTHIFSFGITHTHTHKHTQAHSIGGVIMSQWSGTRGQEWGIETSFRLTIMDHLQQVSIPMGCALSHMRNAYICWKFCLYSSHVLRAHCKNPSQDSFKKPSIHPDEKQLTGAWEERLREIMNPTVRSNTSPAYLEPKNPDAILTQLQSRQLQPYENHVTIPSIARACVWARVH
jgi:hypothetical protein